MLVDEEEREEKRGNLVRSMIDRETRERERERGKFGGSAIALGLPYQSCFVHHLVVMTQYSMTWRKKKERKREEDR